MNPPLPPLPVAPSGCWYAWPHVLHCSPGGTGGAFQGSSAAPALNVNGLAETIFTVVIWAIVIYVGYRVYRHFRKVAKA